MKETGIGQGGESEDGQENDENPVKIEFAQKHHGTENTLSSQPKTDASIGSIGPKLATRRSVSKLYHTWPFPAKWGLGADKKSKNQ